MPWLAVSSGNCEAPSGSTPVRRAATNRPAKRQRQVRTERTVAQQVSAAERRNTNRRCANNKALRGSTPSGVDVSLRVCRLPTDVWLLPGISAHSIDVDGEAVRRVCEGDLLAALLELEWDADGGDDCVAAGALRVVDGSIDLVFINDGVAEEVNMPIDALGDAEDVTVAADGDNAVEREAACVSIDGVLDQDALLVNEVAFVTALRLAECVLTSLVEDRTERLCVFDLSSVDEEVNDPSACDNDNDLVASDSDNALVTVARSSTETSDLAAHVLSTVFHRRVRWRDVDTSSPSEGSATSSATRRSSFHWLRAATVLLLDYASLWYACVDVC
ncbi:Hypothetical protein, putative [Bodo saltans]|uniref:Uncharacterized protein n=1 Tax=Bodo saltans TaxID=75058 RepID=A0A0S4JJK4_BODSA|nr:Hypothetical protein, putative [Bodo saltans]|eukprot:CUG89367.1 Hypothetical protein, putative [Bodo saltans]